jgi:hypothetical protein
MTDARLLPTFPAQLSGLSPLVQELLNLGRAIAKSAVAHPDHGQIRQAPGRVVPHSIPADPQPFGNFVRGQKLLNHLI